MYELLSLDDMSHALDMSVGSLYNLIDEGMPYVKHKGEIKFLYQEVMYWIRKQ